MQKESGWKRNITRQQNKGQEQEDLPKSLAIQMSEGMQTNQLLLVLQKSPRTKISKKNHNEQLLDKIDNIVGIKLQVMLTTAKEEVNRSFWSLKRIME